jgi:hypothetical protein
VPGVRACDEAAIALATDAIDTMDSRDSTHGRENATAHTAPWLPIPSRAVSVVEHPCLIKNIDKGVVSLGGPVKLSKVRGALRLLDGITTSLQLTCT